MLLDWISLFAEGVDPKWIESHEQFRPFILAHLGRAQAGIALRDGKPRRALDVVRRIYKAIHEIYCHYDIEEPLIENDDLLVELRGLEHEILRLIGLPHDAVHDDGHCREHCHEQHCCEEECVGDCNAVMAEESPISDETESAVKCDRFHIPRVPESANYGENPAMSSSDDDTTMLSQLTRQLVDAVKNEDYELAAHLRDWIHRLRGG